MAFYKVFRIKALWQHILSFQDGAAAKDWVDGDLASNLGHLYLLKTLPNLIFSCRAIDGAAACGQLEVVKYLNENRTEGCTEDAMNYAAENGHLEVVKYLHENLNQTPGHQAFLLAAANGHFTVVKYLHPFCSDCPYGKLHSAVIGSENLLLMKWLDENYPENPDNFEGDIIAVAETGNLEMVKYFVAKLKLDTFPRFSTKKIPSFFVAQTAVRSGHAEIVQYFEQIDKNFDYDTAIINACIIGHQPMVEFLIKNRLGAQEDQKSASPLPFKIFENAIESGSLPLVKYLKENFPQQCQLNDHAANLAMNNICLRGNFELFLYIYQNFPNSRNVNSLETGLDYVAMNGDLSFVKFMCEHGFNKSGLAVSYASLVGNLETVKYLVENHPLSERPYSNRGPTFDFFYANKFRQNFETNMLDSLNVKFTAVSYAARNGHLQVVKYLLSKGYHPGCAINYAVVNGDLEILKKVVEFFSAHPDAEEFLPENKIPVEVIYEVIKSRHDHVIKYLLEKSLIVIDKQLIVCTAACGNVRYLKFFYSRNPDAFNTLSPNLVANYCTNYLQVFKFFEALQLIKVELINFEKLIEKGNLTLIQYLIENYRIPRTYLVEDAVINNKLTIAKYLIENGFPYSPNFIMIAADHDNFDMIKLLHSKIDNPAEVKVIFKEYAEGIFEWLEEHSYTVEYPDE